MNEEERLRSWFTAVDQDASGQVTAEELQQALAHGGLHFSKSAAALLIRMCDQDRNGVVNFNEFVHLHRFIVSVQESFRAVDRDRSGGLDRQEVWEALTLNGFRLDENAFSSIFSSFDWDRSSTLRLDDFIQMAAFLQSARNMFSAFDPMNTGRITLNADQFFYAVAHLR